MKTAGHRALCLTTLTALLCLASTSGIAQQPNMPADDLAKDFKAPVQPSDFEKRVVMLPMRDGTKLYTVIVVPKGAKGAPILLTRTPYNAAKRAERSGKRTHDRGVTA